VPALFAAASSGAVCCSTHIVYLWDREDQVRVDRWYREFHRPSLLINNWHHNRLPFEKGMSAAAEYPYAVTACFSHGSLVRAR